jgi:RNA recognition motif-containing protein
MYATPFMGVIPGKKVIRKPSRPAPQEPQATLYVRNLNEKLQPKVLAKGLAAVFGQFGKVVGIKAKRNLKHRGQAFVSFESKEIASEAKRKAQGFPLFEKPMDIQYALEPSFAVTTLDGKEKLESHKRKRQMGGIERINFIDDMKEQKQKKPKDQEVVGLNQILFLQNLPSGTDQERLKTLFSKFSGFKEVRLVPGRADIAFVEYDTELEASTAKTSLHGYRLGDKEIKVTFAKK